MAMIYHPEDAQKKAAITAIADKIVPQYRSPKGKYSCAGQMAKRWQAAYDAASMAREGGQ